MSEDEQFSLQQISEKLTAQKFNPILSCIGRLCLFDVFQGFIQKYIAS